jgi:hypothetical protein
MNGVHCTTHLRNAGRKERTKLLMKRWFLLHDNVRPHIADVAIETLAGVCVTPVEHPSYSPDLTTCDCWAFPLLKHEQRGQKSSSDTEVKQATAATLRKTSGNGLLHMFEKWVGCCKKNV